MADLPENKVEKKAKPPKREAAPKKDGPKKPNFFKRIGSKIVRFFKECKSEVKKISWPSRQSVIKNTLIVLVFMLIAGSFIWVADFAFSQAVTALAPAEVTTTTTESYE